MRLLFALVISMFWSTLIYSQIPPGYYNSVAGLSGNALKSALNDIIDGHVEFPYTSSSMDAWDVLKLADQDPDTPTNVIGLYSNFSMNGPLEYNNARGWSREHVWAKSRGDFSTSPGIGTDLHNLRAEDISTNTARNNRNFDEATIQYIDGSGNYFGTTDSYTSATEWIWEPRDEVKGDVARIIFYMSVRYEGEHGELDLELTDSILPKSSKLPLHGNARTLYRWHLADTVSAAERRRNDTIFKYQQNRNPFVDHPEYVAAIYGATYGTTVGEVATQRATPVLLTVFPTPSTDSFTVSLNNGVLRVVSIYDARGVRILQQHLNSTNRMKFQTPLKRGFYTIEAIDANNRIWTVKHMVY